MCPAVNHSEENFNLVNILLVENRHEAEVDVVDRVEDEGTGKGLIWSSINKQWSMGHPSGCFNTMHPQSLRWIVMCASLFRNKTRLQHQPT